MDEVAAKTWKRRIWKLLAINVNRAGLEDYSAGQSERTRYTCFQTELRVSLNRCRTKGSGTDRW
jgi:hypothetical protein